MRRDTIRDTPRTSVFTRRALLMMGGRRGLADGGWGPTSVAEVLRVTITPGATAKR